MTGYEEVLTDPSYKGQLVMLTYPLIGNYGINQQDMQSKQLHLEALIVKEYVPYPSHFGSQYSLKEYLEANDILGIEDIDTRYITRKLRHHGALKAFLTTSTMSDEDAIEQCRLFKGIDRINLVETVSTSDPYSLKCPNKAIFNVALIDCGVKLGIINQLHAIGCDVTVFPYNVSADHILKENFDGVMLSNGPGNPEMVTATLTFIKDIIGKIPLFGICLGHQLLSIAMGFSLEKLTFGHHGVNHPIQNTYTGAVEITSQNHIYCTTRTSCPDTFDISHINLNDQTVAGICSESLKAFSVQYHPESSPGPYDSHYLFKEFAHLMTHHSFQLLTNQQNQNDKETTHAKTN